MFLLAVCCVSCAADELLSNFGVGNKTIGKTKLLNKTVQCFSLAEKREFCGSTSGKYPFSKSRYQHQQMMEIQVNEK
jgi:hypothetical protein